MVIPTDLIPEDQIPFLSEYATVIVDDDQTITKDRHFDSKIESGVLQVPLHNDERVHPYQRGRASITG